MSAGLKVAVIGAGVAGTAAAFLLSQQGHQVSLFEAQPAPEPLGAGLLLQPTGQAVLKHMGLWPSVHGLGARVDHLFGDTPSGRTVLDMRYGDIAPEVFGLGVQRGALMQTLWQAARLAPITWHLGASVDDICSHAQGVELRSGQASLGQFEGVVVASGAGAPLRQTLRVNQVVKPYPWGALWTLLPLVPELQGLQLRQRYFRAEKMLGLMPVGRATSQEDSPAMVNVFWSLPAHQIDAAAQADVTPLKREMTQLLPEAAPLLEGLTQPAQWRKARYVDVTMPQWHDGRIVALGDSGHAMSPQLGQGANLALIDAWVLASSLRTIMKDHAAAQAWPRAAAHYTRQRRSHLRYYHQASRALTPLFQSHSRFWPALRDACFGPMCKLPYLRSQSMATLAGMKTGWLIGRMDI